MTDDLEQHQPSEDARGRAKAAGYDLDALKHDDPVTYRMLCAVPVIRSAKELTPLAQSPLQVALGGRQLYEAQVKERMLVLAFPGPGPVELRKLDELMGAAVEEALGRYAYYRVVQDRSGTRRELDLPSSPESWQGESTMIGPFAHEAAARDWGQERVIGHAGLTYDVLNYAGGWFCDVFSAADA
ncbi:MAG: hypothetical protein WD273_03960 [Trueperaceae bacterium]